MTSNVSALTPRGTSVCRGCGGTELVPVLDLGDQPLANELPSDADSPSPAFPLFLRICPQCALGQVGEYVLPERIFGRDYPYLSSTSTSWVQHARDYARRMVQELGLDSETLAVEIASNDGYLLRGLQDEKLPVLGIEPASNIAALAEQAGVPTLTQFFSTAVAREVVAGHGHPRLVTANNVMAHVPDLNDFTGGLAALCDDDTIVTVENPSFVGLLLERQFDTIYHEHFSYLSAHAVRAVVATHGLELFRVERLPTHGGSHRYWLRRSRGLPLDASVDSVISDEIEGGLLDPAVWTSFATESRRAVAGLRAWLEERAARGRQVAAYGAAAKGNTLLNAAGATRAHLSYVVDASPEKQGRVLPGPAVPVLAPTHLALAPPDDVLLLPWNLAAELRPLVHAAAPEAEVWIAIPEMAPVR